MENERQEERAENAFLIPLSILVAGAIVGATVLFGGSSGSDAAARQEPAGQARPAQGGPSCGV